MSLVVHPAIRKPSWNACLLALMATGLLMSVGVPDTHAIVIRHDVDDSLYKELAQTEPFYPVGQLRAHFDFFMMENGSAVLIGDSWILTAAHCVVGDNYSDVEGFSVRWDIPGVGSITRAAAEWFVHPTGTARSAATT